MALPGHTDEQTNTLTRIHSQTDNVQPAHQQTHAHAYAHDTHIQINNVRMIGFVTIVCRTHFKLEILLKEAFLSEQILRPSSNWLF